MRRSAHLLALFGAGVLAAAQVASQELTMNVRQGPESTFSAPPESLFPDLVGATATDRNGRVGNELVFWGYELADGREVNLVACAAIRGVDCEERLQKICPLGVDKLGDTETEGLVRHIRCSGVGFARPGDLRPGCSERESDSQLAVWLIQCS